jgi:hypothetical protein
MNMSAVHSEVEPIRSGLESRPDLIRSDHHSRVDSLSRPGERQPESRPSVPESRGEKPTLRTQSLNAHSHSASLSIPTKPTPSLRELREVKDNIKIEKVSPRNKK